MGMWRTDFVPQSLAEKQTSCQGRHRHLCFLPPGHPSTLQRPIYLLPDNSAACPFMPLHTQIPGWGSPQSPVMEKSFKCNLGKGLDQKELIPSFHLPLLEVKVRSRRQLEEFHLGLSARKYHPPPQAKARSPVQGWAEDSYTESETLAKAQDHEQI